MQMSINLQPLQASSVEVAPQTNVKDLKYRPDVRHAPVNRTDNRAQFSQFLGDRYGQGRFALCCYPCKPGKASIFFFVKNIHRRG